MTDMGQYNMDIVKPVVGLVAALAGLGMIGLGMSDVFTLSMGLIAGIPLIVIGALVASNTSESS